MHHTGVMSRKICSLGIRTLNPEYVRTINERLYPLDHHGKHCQFTFEKNIYSFSTVIDSFQGMFFFGFRLELNL